MNTIGGEFRTQQQAPRPMSGGGGFGADDFSTAGERLRARREALGIPVEAIVRKTRMPRRTVELLEDDKFSTVGAEFYVRGFLKLYAEHLGMPMEPLIEAYERQVALAVEHTDETLPDYFQASTEPTRRLSPAQIFLLVVCAATLVVFMMSVQKQRGSHVVAKRPAISAPGTPATAQTPTPAHGTHDQPTAADAIGN